MDKKSLKNIERIMTICNELHILTMGKDAEYFYDRLEMNILIHLIEEVDTCIKKLSNALREKYKEVDWNIIDNTRYVDEVMGKSMKVGKAWEVACSLYDLIYDKLNDILKYELENYYHGVCIKKQREIRKKKALN